MSPQETQALQDFLNQLTEVRGIAKDPQADAMIASAVARQPDAAYLLVQRALLVDQALTASKAQVAALQNQLQAMQAAAAPAPGFLDSNAWGHAPAAVPRASTPAVAPPAYAPPPAQPYATAPAPSAGFLSGGMGSMLGTVAATAAGVAGGAFLFQGIEHMMHGNSGSGLFGQGSGNPVERVDNTTVNNYYDSDGDKSSTRAGSDSMRGDNGDSSGNDLSDLADVDLDDMGDDSSVV